MDPNGTRPSRGQQRERGSTEICRRKFGRSQNQSCVEPEENLSRCHSSFVPTCPTESLSSLGEWSSGIEGESGRLTEIFDSHGSLGFLPRKRAARHRGKVKSFPRVSTLSLYSLAIWGIGTQNRDVGTDFSHFSFRMTPRSPSTSPPSSDTRPV